MARGDHDSAGRALAYDRQRDGGSRQWTRSQDDCKPVADEDLRGAPGKLVGKEAAIVTDHHLGLARSDRVTEPIGGGRLADALEVGKSKTVCDDGAPSVGSEFNL